MATTPPSTIAEAIEQNAKEGIRSSSVDGHSVATMTVDEQIRADRYRGAKAAAATGYLPIRQSKVISSGL